MSAGRVQLVTGVLLRSPLQTGKKWEKRMRRNQVSVLWIGTGAVATIAAAAGILVPGLYAGLVAPAVLAGALSQDIISLIAAVALIILGGTLREDRPKRRLVGLGLLGYLFYAFGIYVIERAYNELYLVYLAIFALTFWAILFGAIDATRRLAGEAHLSRRARILSASGSLLQPLVFYPAWIALLIPLMAGRDQIDSLYSIFILDLCFIMPAFLILAVSTFRNRGAGLVLSPSMFVLGATLIFSLGLAELLQPAFGRPTSVPSLVASLALTALFAALTVVHLSRLTLVTPHRAPIVAPASPRSSDGSRGPLSVQAGDLG